MRAASRAPFARRRAGAAHGSAPLCPSGCLAFELRLKVKHAVRPEVPNWSRNLETFVSGSALQGQEPAPQAALLCQADALRFLPGLSSIPGWLHFPEAEPNSPHCRHPAAYGSSNFPPGFVNESKAVVLLPLSLLRQGKAFQAGDLPCAHVHVYTGEKDSL